MYDNLYIYIYIYIYILLIKHRSFPSKLYIQLKLGFVFILTSRVFQTNIIIYIETIDKIIIKLNDL